MPFFLSEDRLVLASRTGPGGPVVDLAYIGVTSETYNTIPEIGPWEELIADAGGVALRLRFGIKPETFRAWIDDEPAPCVVTPLHDGVSFRNNSPDVFFGGGARHLFRYEVALFDGYRRRRTLAFAVPPPLNVEELRGRLRIFHRPSTGRAALEWADDARLYTAPAPTGPWTEVTNAATPKILPDTDGTRFFRVARP